MEHIIVVLVAIKDFSYSEIFAANNVQLELSKIHLQIHAIIVIRCVIHVKIPPLIALLVNNSKYYIKENVIITAHLVLIRAINKIFVFSVIGVVYNVNLKVNKVVQPAKVIDI